MAAILVAPLLIAYDSLNATRAAVRGVQEQDLNATMLLARIRSTAEELRQSELQLVYATDSGTAGRPDTRVMSASSALRVLADSLTSYGLTNARSEIMATLD